MTNIINDISNNYAVANYLDLYNFNDKYSINWMALPLYKKIEYSATRFNSNIKYFVDKLLAKDTVNYWIQNLIIPLGFNFANNLLNIPQTVRIITDPSNITYFDLNANTILKSTHGFNSRLNINILSNSLNSWNISRVQKRIWSFERNIIYPIQNQYNFIDKKYFFETKIDDPNSDQTGSAVVYSIYLINNVPFAFSECFEGEFNKYELNLQNNITYISKTLLDNKNTRINIPNLPVNIMQNLITISRFLSIPFEFIRMDFFVDRYLQIWFNEFTLTPNCTKPLFNDIKEIEYGLKWT
jgi:hypothetical protein